MRKHFLTTIGTILILSCVGLFLLKNYHTGSNSTDTPFDSNLHNSPNVTIVTPEKINISSEDVVYENQQLFVDSQLLLTVEEKTDYQTVDELVKQYGGAIIGYISFSGDYQIQFSVKKSLSELNQIIEKWSKKEFVCSVSLNYVTYNSISAMDYTNDPWLDTSPDAPSPQVVIWSEESHVGNNWWAEAVFLPTVWNMDIWDSQKSAPIKIGIIDSVFDETHQDLDGVFEKTWENSFTASALAPDVYTHGTHVAGLIGAEIGNNIGISGTASCANPRLYGFAIYGNENEKYVSDRMSVKYAIALMLEQGVKLINRSMGLDHELVFSAQKGNKSAQIRIEELNSTLSDFLQKAINAGYDFLIINSSGNASGYTFVQCDESREHPYGYRLVNDYERQDSSIRKYSSTCSSKYEDFAGIRDPEIKQHILIVGAAEQEYDTTINKAVGYHCARFSNIDCDVYAPGVDILSTVCGNTETDIQTGTSMAAPITTGIAALVWQANPSLTSTQVRDIIIQTVGTEIISSTTLQNDSTVKIVNAAAAVQLALTYSNDSHQQFDSVAFLMGNVYTEQTNESGTEQIEVPNAIVLITRDNALIKQIHLDKKTGFDEILPKGHYTVIVNADGFISQSFEIDLFDSIFIAANMKTVTDNLFSLSKPPVNLPEEFFCITTSGRSSWKISTKPTGEFESTFTTMNFGENGDDYPLGTGYLTKETGTFRDFEKISENTYKFYAHNISSIGDNGNTYIEDDIRYIVENEDALHQDGDEFYLILPGTPFSSYPQNIIDSINNNGFYGMNYISDTTFVLYQVNPDFYGYDFVWIGDGSESVAQENTVEPNITWSLSKDGTLTISGTGEMEDYGVEEGEQAPWMNQGISVKKVIFEGEITRIGSAAFAYTDIEKITIPSSVTEISNFAFANCRKLSKITWSSKIHSIGIGAFSGCTSLNYLCLPSSVSIINADTFSDCTNLSSIRFSGKIDAIGSSAFESCPLATVYYEGTEKQWEKLMKNCADDVIKRANICYVDYESF